MSETIDASDFFESEDVLNDDNYKEKPTNGGRKTIAALLTAVLLLVSAIVYLQFYYKADSQKPVVEAIARGTGATFLKDPLSVAVYNDKFYVADANNGRIVVFLDNGTPLYDFSGGTLHDAPNLKLKYPNGIAVNKRGEVFVADIEAAQIVVFSESGRALRRFELLEKRKIRIKPLAVAFDERDNLYVAEANTKSIYIYDSKGSLSRVIGGGKLNYPNGVAVNLDGDIYVADSNAQQILVFSSSGALKNTIDRGADKKAFLPRGMAFSKKGNLLVADTLNSEIVEFDQKGNEIASWGKPGVEDDELTFPNGIAYSSKGKLFIADRGNNRVIMLRNFPK